MLSNIWKALTLEVRKLSCFGYQSPIDYNGKPSVIAYYSEKATYPTGLQVMFYSKNIASALF